MQCSSGHSQQVSIPSWHHPMHQDLTVAEGRNSTSHVRLEVTPNRLPVTV